MNDGTEYEMDEHGRWGDGNKSFIDNSYEDSEIFIGLIGAVGTDLSYVFKIIEDRLKKYNYECIKIRISDLTSRAPVLMAAPLPLL